MVKNNVFKNQTTGFSLQVICEPFNSRHFLLPSKIAIAIKVQTIITHSSQATIAHNNPDIDFHNAYVCFKQRSVKKPREHN
jgi:hypothetical protein